MLRLSWGFDNNNNTKNIKTNYFLIRGPIPTTTPVGNRVNFRFKSRLLPWHLASVKDGPRNLRLKFGQNRISNRWDIPNMDKCCQDRYCMDKCQCDNWNLFKMAWGTYLLNFVLATSELLFNARPRSFDLEGFCEIPWGRNSRQNSPLPWILLFSLILYDHYLFSSDIRGIATR